jgi:hypothetical protein
MGEEYVATKLFYTTQTIHQITIEDPHAYKLKTKTLLLCNIWWPQPYNDRIWARKNQCCKPRWI